MAKKAKRFDSETEEFEKFAYSKDLILLEKYRFICAQILIAKWKMEKLKEALIAGTSYSSTEAEAKIKELNKRYTLLASRFTLAKGSIEEMTKSTHKLKKGTLSGEIMQNYLKIRKKMVQIEKRFGRLSNIKAPELFTHLTREVEEYREKIKALEEAFGETEDAMLSVKLDKTKKMLGEYEKAMGPEKLEEVMKDEV